MELGVPLSYAGIVSMIISGGTILSSLLSDRMTRKTSAGFVTAVSVFMTAAALFGFSTAPSFFVICLWAVPYGLGAGAVDAALNNYVALHFKARHMSWLHCFWGIGVSVSPYIMGLFLTRSSSWHGGYRAVSYIQLMLSAVLFAALPLWKSVSEKTVSDKEQAVISNGRKTVKHTIFSVFRIKGVPLVLVSFFGYCALESTAGLWAASYLVQFRGVAAETAARFASFFYIGIMAGRFLNGFIAERAGDSSLIRIGCTVAILGIILIILPFSSDVPALAGLITAGIGCAPVYPSIIHATPARFGKENSQAVVGIQMASAYTGSTFMPPLFGLVAQNVSISLYPFWLLVFAFLTLFCSELLERCLKNNTK